MALAFARSAIALQVVAHRVSDYVKDNCEIGARTSMQLSFARVSRTQLQACAHARDLNNAPALSHAGAEQRGTAYVPGFEAQPAVFRLRDRGTLPGGERRHGAVLR